VASLADLVVRVTSDVKGVQVGMAKTRAELQKTQKEADETGKHFKASNAIIAAGATAVAGAVGAFALKSVNTYKDYGKQVKTVNRLLGGSFEDASLIVGQMKLIGGEEMNAGDALKFFSKNLGEAHSGAGPASEVFKQLGIDLKDTNGEWRTGTDVLMESREKLAAWTDESERANMASKLMGRGFSGALAWFTKSKKDIEESTKFLKDMGLVMSDKDMERWSELMGDEKKLAMVNVALQMQMGKLVADLENKVMPTVIKLAEAFTKVPSGVWLAIGAFAGLVGAINGVKTVLGVFNGARGLLGLERAGEEVGPVLGNLRGGLRGVASGIVSGVKGMGRWIQAVPGLVAANLSLIASFAVVAAGIYAIVRAYQAWREAADQAAAAAANSASADQGAKDKVAAWQAAHPGQALPAGYQKLLDYSNQNPADYQSPKGLWGWLGAAQQGSTDYWKPGGGFSQFMGFANGGVAKAPKSGGLAVLHGVERITPVGKEEPKVAFDFRGARFDGTSEQTIRGIFDRDIVPRILDVMAGANA
jgi:hypothetical protein